MIFREAFRTVSKFTRRRKSNSPAAMASEPPTEPKKRKGTPRAAWGAYSPGGTQEGIVAGRNATRRLVDTPGGQHRYPHMNCVSPAAAACSLEKPCADCNRRNRDSTRNSRTAKEATSLVSLSGRARALGLPVKETLPSTEKEDPASRVAAQKLLSKQVARAASEEHPSDISHARRAAHQTSPHGSQMVKARDLYVRPGSRPSSRQGKGRRRGAKVHYRGDYNLGATSQVCRCVQQPRTHVYEWIVQH